MLALIGFVGLVVAGAIFLLTALFVFVVTAGLSGDVEWPPVIVFGSLGGACLWAAVHWAPFSVNWVG